MLNGLSLRSGPFCLSLPEAPLSSAQGSIDAPALPMGRGWRLAQPLAFWSGAWDFAYASGRVGLLAIDGVHIRCCGNGYLGFRPYGGSLFFKRQKK